MPFGFTQGGSQDLGSLIYSYLKVILSQGLMETMLFP